MVISNYNVNWETGVESVVKFKAFSSFFLIYTFIYYSMSILSF